VVTNETCDHRCGFCDARREHERASVAAHAAVVARIDAAVGHDEIVLTGGEPTLRNDLPRLVARARVVATSVVLETNGARIDDALAVRLAHAGLATARLHVPAMREHAAITGDAEGWSRLCRAATALARAGIRVEASIPIAVATLVELGTLPWAIAVAMPAVAALRARVIQRAPDPATVLSPQHAIAGFEQLAEAARAASLPLQLDPATHVPPCLLARPDRHAHAYTLGPGGAQRDDHVRVSACTACVLHDRCPGVPTQWLAYAESHAKPIAEDRLRRRLSIALSTDAQIARELVSDEPYRRPDGTAVPSRIVRVGFACNQACTFCFVSTHLPSAPRADVARAIDDIAAQGGVLVLSGGEPTLDPALVEWVRRGKRGGAIEIELQTNATRIDPSLADALVEAGLDVAFVSLHAATAEVSDAITNTPGTFVQTLAGLDALAGRVPTLRVNFVFCRPNIAEFPAFVDLVAASWPAATITVSFVAPSTDLVPHTSELVPRYTDVVPALVEGLRRARAHGVDVGGFDSMCGIPLCLVPVADRVPMLAREPIASGTGNGELVAAPQCAGCSLRTQCHGVRRGYAALHGTTELVRQ